MNFTTFEWVITGLVVWLIIGWIAIYVVKIGEVTQGIDAIERAGFVYTAVLANIAVLVLWPVAPVVLIPIMEAVHKLHHANYLAVKEQCDELIKRQKEQ